MFKDSTVLITGGTGSWGNELTKQLIPFNPKRIIIFSRGELAQVKMQRKFSAVDYVIGDVRDKDAVDKLFKQPIDFVFHLAALKHVPICENHPKEAVKTNVLGTINLIDAALVHSVQKFIDVSTDKCVAPSNLYGMSKAIGEKLTIQANNLGDCDFVCIRGGNVLGSNGSVVPLFIEQAKAQRKITLTTNEATRFFLTLSEAIGLLFEATKKSVGGETFVMNMPSFKIGHLAEVIAEAFSATIETIGLREGEKIHEVLVSQHEAPRTKLFGDYYVVLPELKIKRDYSHLAGAKDVEFFEFSSQNNLKGKKEIKSMLEIGEFL